MAMSSRVPGLQLDRSELVIEQLARERLLQPGDVCPADPAPVVDLARAHAPAYLEATAQAVTLGHIFGLAPEAVDVDELVMAQRYAVGGTVAAAATAAGAGEPLVCFNLGGGFHHAHPEQGSGFCIYNDVAVAIARLRAEGNAGRIAVVDLDFHQGDGTMVAFAADSEVLTYSLHGSVWSHVEATANVGRELPNGTGDEAYMDELRQSLPAALDAHRPELAFYLAGNDVLEGDRLGDFVLSRAGVFRRDRFVVEQIRRRGIPLVITLAGGYSPDAWRCSVNLLRWLLTDSLKIPVVEAPSLRTHYARIAHELRPNDLQRGDSGELVFTEADLMADLQGPPPARLILDYYTPRGIEFALERYGLLDDLRAKGFADVAITCEPQDPAHQIIRVRGRRKKGPPLLLVELVVRRQHVALPSQGSDESVELLRVEWLLLQDPTAEFTLERPRLPGQDHPGLGMARNASELFIRVCDRLKLEGVVHCPAHYHTGVVGWRRYRFLDPAVEGRVNALRELLAGVDLATASTAVADGRLRLADDSVVAWEPVEQMLPVSDVMKEYFEGERYVAAVEAEKARMLDAGLHLVDEPPPF